MEDIYFEITQKMIAMVQKGTAPWRKPWGVDTAMPMPMNAETRRYYRGINIPLLWMAQHDMGFKTPMWGTKETWKRLNGVPLKNARPTQVYLFRRGVSKRRGGAAVMLTSFDVFNLYQIWGCLVFRQNLSLPVNEVAEAKLDFPPGDRIIDRNNPKIVHRGNRAFYNTSTDVVTLPYKKLFHSRSGYWTTKLHEMIHWTGHLVRLKRKFGRTKESQEYAFEELIAELGTCFICSILGLPEALDEMPQHASYIAQWLTIMRGDEKAIFQAASAATKAVEFLMDTTCAFDHDDEE